MLGATMDAGNHSIPPFDMLARSITLVYESQIICPTSRCTGRADARRLSSALGRSPNVIIVNGFVSGKEFADRIVKLIKDRWSAQFFTLTRLGTWPSDCCWQSHYPCNWHVSAFSIVGLWNADHLPNKQMHRTGWRPPVIFGVGQTTLWHTKFICYLSQC